jgi:hypothetical protein
MRSSLGWHIYVTFILGLFPLCRVSLAGLIRRCSFLFHLLLYLCRGFPFDIPVLLWLLCLRKCFFFFHLPYISERFFVFFSFVLFGRRFYLRQRLFIPFYSLCSPLCILRPDWFFWLFIPLYIFILKIRDGASTSISLLLFFWLAWFFSGIIPTGTS